MINNRSVKNISRDKYSYQGIDKEQIIREAIPVDTFNNLQFSTKESKKELIVTTNISDKDIFKVNLKGNAPFQGVQLVNTTFQPKSKGGVLMIQSIIPT